MDRHVVAFAVALGAGMATAGAAALDLKSAPACAREYAARRAAIEAAGEPKGLFLQACRRMPTNIETPIGNDGLAPTPPDIPRHSGADPD